MWTVIVVAASFVFALHQAVVAMLVFDVVAIAVLLVIATLTGDAPGGPRVD